jgi:hypothetical protein
VFPLEGIEIDLPLVSSSHTDIAQLFAQALGEWRRELESIPTFDFIQSTAKMKGISKVLSKLQEVVAATVQEKRAISKVKRVSATILSLAHTVLIESLDMTSRTSHVVSEVVHCALPQDQHRVVVRRGHVDLSSQLHSAFTVLNMEVTKAMEVLTELSSDSGIELQIDVVLCKVSEILLRPVAGLSEAVSITSRGLYDSLNSGECEEASVYVPSDENSEASMYDRSGSRLADISVDDLCRL